MDWVRINYSLPEQDYKQMLHLLEIGKANYLHHGRYDKADEADILIEQLKEYSAPDNSAGS